MKVDNTIHTRNHHPMDSVVCFVNTYPLNGDLSGQRYLAFGQLGPVCYFGGYVSDHFGPTWSEIVLIPQRSLPFPLYKG